jgi:uncharacterized protein
MPPAYAELSMNAPPVLNFDDYGVKSEFDPGAHARVFCVHRSGQEFALKWMHEGLKEEGKRRFENEMHALRLLKGSNLPVPEFIGEGAKDGRPFVVMTLRPGKSLKSVVANQLRDMQPASILMCLHVVQTLLRIVCSLAERKVHHRDIKDANVLYDAASSTTSLIDFGFCDSPDIPHKSVSFLPVGTARYSPPSKLKHPASVLTIHDVFAVGVLAYQLLANRFPWSVGDELGHEGDYGDLINQMENAVPSPVSQLNSFVPQAVSDFIAELLQVRDGVRPRPSLALDRASRLLEQCTLLVSPMVAGAIRHDVLDREIRDPIHGDIRLSSYEEELVQSPGFQRLRWIKQLGLTRYVYPGAEHNRLSHSLGTMHTVTAILRAIEVRSGIRFPDDELKIARLYALLHDVTHVPFGHTIEDELGLRARHDNDAERFARLLEGNRSGIGQILRRTSYGRSALDLLRKSVPNDRMQEQIPRELTYIVEAVDSSIGADVIDYINRDAYYCGLDHRVDSAIFRNYSVTRVSSNGPSHFASRVYGRYGIRLDAEFALEDLFTERFALFLKVYTHRKKVAAGAMVGRGIAELMHGRGALSDEAYEWMGDTEVLTRLKESNRRVAKLMGQSLWLGRLYVPVYIAGILDKDELDPAIARQRAERLRQLIAPESRVELEDQIANSLGLENGDVLIHLPASAPGFQKVSHYQERTPFASPEIRDETQSPHLSIRQRHLRLWTAYAFVRVDADQRIHERVSEQMQELVRRNNEIAIDRRLGLRG